MRWQVRATPLVVVCVLAIFHKVACQDNSTRSMVYVKRDLDNLKCPACEQIHCSPRRPSRLKCKGGITLGICNCCPVCAKIEGESCGGRYEYLGKCDRGLICEPQPTASPNHPNKGICKKIPAELLDEGHPSFCRPKCTPEFCKRNTKAICAAVDVADNKRGCQGQCQHTSCLACRFVDHEPDCIKCHLDDFDCMKKYAQCIKQQYCTKNKFPCKKVSNEEVGKFQCMVPECSDS